MSNVLLVLLAASSTYLPFTPLDLLQTIGYEENKPLCKIPPVATLGYTPPVSLDEVKEMLHNESANLSSPVINKVLTSFKCALLNNVPHNNVLTVIDYSLPSNQKRLWVFDLRAKKLLFYTYVAHGIKSGALFTDFFSNKYNSKASSIGVYKTEKSYYGREGLSLRLDGLDYSFNDNASNRSIVMHGGWYVEEPFIKKYGRPGRSWGCPALPLGLYQPIINTIKENTLIVAYYPNENWVNKSRFLNCEHHAPTNNKVVTEQAKESLGDNELRGDVLLGGVNKSFHSESNEAIVAMKADNYEQLFHVKPPLGRMLRRQIDKTEYIALSNIEFKQMFIDKMPEFKLDDKEALNSVYFITPVIKMVRGYYETQMKIINLGTIKEVRMNADSSPKKGQTGSFTVYFEDKPALSLRPTDRFIRWVGL